MAGKAWWQKQEAGKSHDIHTRRKKKFRKWGWAIKPQGLFSVTHIFSSNIYLLMVLQPSSTATPSWEHVSKYMSLWGHSTCKPQAPLKGQGLFLVYFWVFHVNNYALQAGIMSSLSILSELP